MTRDDAIHMLRSYLDEQLHDPALAQALAGAVHDCLLDWSVPTAALDGVAAVIAFAFGCRRLPSGNTIPGPMNERVADVVAGLYAELGCPVYAQWEVAEALGGRVPEGMLHTIYPDQATDGSGVAYLSTFGVLQKVRNAVGDPGRLGTVLVAAWRHHAPRCIRLARSLGFDAFAPPRPLPDTYDVESAQSWTRSAHAYLLHDGLARLERHRAALFPDSSPSGLL